MKELQYYYKLKEHFEKQGRQDLAARVAETIRKMEEEK